MIIRGRELKQDVNFDSKTSQNVVIIDKIIHRYSSLSKPFFGEVKCRNACPGYMSPTGDILFTLALTIFIFGAVFSMAIMARI